MNPMLLSEEVCNAIAQMQDELFQRMEADGFAIEELLALDFRQSRSNQRFKLGQPTVSCSKYNFSRRDAGRFFYEKILSSLVHGELGCDTQDIFVCYRVVREVEETSIRLNVICYIRHPDEYKQALRDAGAICTSPPNEPSEFIQCGIGGA